MPAEFRLSRRAIERFSFGPLCARPLSRYTTEKRTNGALRYAPVRANRVRFRTPSLSFGPRHEFNYRPADAKRRACRLLFRFVAKRVAPEKTNGRARKRSRRNLPPDETSRAHVRFGLAFFVVP